MVVAKLKICRNRSRAVGALPRARRKYCSEWRRALGPNRKKYAGMQYRMMRLALRPQRKERNAMTLNNQRLPRSRCLTHSAALGLRSRRFADLGFMQRAAGYFAIIDADREMNQPRPGRLVLQDEMVARPNRIEKFRRRDMPRFKVDSPRQLDGREHLVQQYCARQHRKGREMTRERRVVGGNVECTLHFHCDSLIRNWSSANPCKACCGSLPVGLGGSSTTINKGRGRNTGSISWRSCSIKAATVSPGATTTAPSRVTPVEPDISSRRKNAPSIPPGMALSCVFK